MSRRPNRRLDVLMETAPDLHAAVLTRRWQARAARFIADRPACLIADDPGLGKTIELIAGVTEAANSTTPGWHLIVSPLIATAIVWPPEIEERLGNRARVVVPAGTHAKRAQELAELWSSPHDGRELYVCVNPEMLRDESKFPQLFAHRWTTVVSDEAHKYLIKTRGGGSAVRKGFMGLRSERRVALSGTPMRGNPMNLWGTLNWLRPDLYKSYWRWVGEYWKIESTRHTDFAIGEFQASGEDRLAADLQSIMLRRSGEEIGQIPPTFVGTHLIPGDKNSPFGVWLKPNAEQVRQEKQLVTTGIITFKDGQSVMANGALPISVRRTQVAVSPLAYKAKNNGDQGVTPTADSPMFDWLMAKFDELGIVSNEGRSKIVIASAQTSQLDAFSARFKERGVPNFLLTGATSSGRRKSMVRDFQSDNKTVPRVFFLNTFAAGVAITLDAADSFVFLDETQNPDDQLQAWRRIYRTSRQHNIWIYFLRMLGSIQEEISWVTATKEDVSRYILDGSRGVEAVKQRYITSKGATK